MKGGALKVSILELIDEIDWQPLGRLAILGTARDVSVLKEMAKMERTEHFSTHLLDRALARERERRERGRQERLAAVLRALDKLSRQISFEEAYIFGSLAQPYRFFEGSDVDIAFVGLKDEDFFQAIAFLSRELGAEVDVLQLEGHPLQEKIIEEGIRWKRNGPDWPLKILYSLVLRS